MGFAGDIRTGARRLVALIAAAVAALLLVVSGAHAQSPYPQNPVLFVHGIEGSGAQFESQKLRFTSNGYPERWIDAVDYDSTRAVGDKSQVASQIDAAIAELQKRTGRAKVDVVAHSLGTTVMHDYLTNGSMASQRRANVGRYVNVDGQSSNPGVPTLAVWAGRGTPGRRMTGATNVTIPNQTHVQACTSAESFVEYFKFLTGRSPAHDIVAETGQITVAGRALLFPQNSALPAGVTLQVWPVAAATGQRTTSTPAHSLSLPASGDFGPVRIEAGRHYEFVLLRPGIATLHYYYEPFVRSDHLLRLPYSDAVEAVVQRSERHSAGLVIRYKELWGDQRGQSDVLSINGTSVCLPALCPISKQVNALFFYDRNLDGRTDLSSPDPAFSQLPFITGVDVFVPAARPPTGKVTVTLRSRGAGPERSISYPNFPSTTEGAVLQFQDFELASSASSPAAPGGNARGACVTVGGAAKGRRMGPAALGRTRTAQRRLLRSRRLHARVGQDSYCVAGGGTLRIGYPTRRLTRRERGLVRGRSVFVLSSSPRFSVRGIRPGGTVRALRTRLRGERRVTMGANAWYLATGRSATLVYRTHGARVREVGLANRRLTTGTAGARRLLGSWAVRG